MGGRSSACPWRGVVRTALTSSRFASLEQPQPKGALEKTPERQPASLDLRCQPVTAHSMQQPVTQGGAERYHYSSICEKELRPRGCCRPELGQSPGLARARPVQPAVNWEPYLAQLPKSISDPDPGPTGPRPTSFHLGLPHPDVAPPR